MTPRISSVLRSLWALCLCGCVVAIAAAPARAQSVAWPQEFPPRPLAARSVAFPPYQMQTLPNGLQVMVVLHHEQPAVSLRLLVRAGSASDPKSKTGLVHLASSLLDQGTSGARPMSAGEFNDAIDFIGGVAGAGAGTDLSYLNMVVMKDSFDAGLRMLSDMARHPAFDQAEIDRQRQQLLSSLQVSFDDPGFIANAVFDRLVYGFHPYGLPQTGTPETIGQLTRDDVVAFHRKYFVPNNAILAIVGDVTAEEAFVAAGKVFGDWERRDLTAEPGIDPPAPTRRVVIVNKPDSVQTEVRVGNIGIPRNHPDYMAVNLAIRILGGEGSNRLHQVLRTARGLTLQRAGEFRHVQGQRRLRSRNHDTHGSHRRGAAPHRGRVLAASARTGERTGVVGRQGVSHRKLSADDRDARRDRAAGAERDVLRPAASNSCRTSASA